MWWLLKVVLVGNRYDGVHSSFDPKRTGYGAPYMLFRFRSGDLLIYRARS